MVLERHGAAAEAVVASILERVHAVLPPDRVQHVVGSVYGEREAVRQPLQAGNWVTLGEIAAAEAITFVEVNVATGATRERCTWTRLPSRGSRAVPAHNPCRRSAGTSFDQVEVNGHVRDIGPDA